MVLRVLLETGKVVPAIDRTYPLSERPGRHPVCPGRSARGKVVMTV